MVRTRVINLHPTALRLQYPDYCVVKRLANRRYYDCHRRAYTRLPAILQEVRAGRQLLAFGMDGQEITPEVLYQLLGQCTPPAEKLLRLIRHRPEDPV